MFREKLKAFIDDIRNKKIFGDVTAFVYVIEFQKRGTPHCHLILTLADGFKFRQPDQVDKIVSAEIPEDTDVALYECVRAHMVHVAPSIPTHRA